MMALVTENQLDNWARGNAQDAQELVVELVWRLVAASCPQPQERRFPLGDSIGQHGPDGILHFDSGFKPFVPEGYSFWEIGTGLRSRDKATSDYKDLTDKIPESVRAESTFVFVTPLSGRGDWEHTWREGAQANWLEGRRNRNDWMDVRVIDGTKLIDWIHQFPPVEIWLANKIHGQQMQHIETPEHRWEVLRSYGAPPPLTPDVFLINQDRACEKIKEVLDDRATQLTLTTHFPPQAVYFTCAYLASLGEENRMDAAGRSLIISDIDAWNTVCDQWQNLILIADANLDLSGDTGSRAIQKARNAGHAVIISGPRGGRPISSSAPLPMPSSYQLKEALTNAGYTEQRAHTLAGRCDGNLSSLLRLLQGQPVLPTWADKSDSTELATAVLLGSWTDSSEADRAVVNGLTGKEYGEWIGKIREIERIPDTPINYREGNWKFISRYEGWLALGRHFSEEGLDKLRNVAVSVLREKDPRFELPPQERYAASIHGKVLKHSPELRKGLAESLALLGAQSSGLVNCSQHEPENTAIREIFENADWVLWGSLDRLLPILAEAAPDEFLSAVEQALEQRPCPFDELFSQEGDGILGGNYLTGLLWALETLAWDKEFLVRVCVILGDLDTHDPGGNWVNRPSNSLTIILLPWLPQTTAPTKKRKVALTTLRQKFPDVAWRLLLNLLPKQRQMSIPTSKPSWRNTIPDDWKDGVGESEYREQVSSYADLTVEMAISDMEKLKELIDQLDNLTPTAFDKVLEHLSSEAVSSKPEGQRADLWEQLTMFSQKHRIFPDADWSLPDEIVSKTEGVAAQIAPENPLYRHRITFNRNRYDLYPETGDWDEQMKQLEERRRQAIKEILAYGGVDAVVRFAEAVKQPERVGHLLGVVAEAATDGQILPALLETDSEKLTQFVGSYVWSRHGSEGWEWIDGLDRSQWSDSETGQFLSYLPFTGETWKRVTDWLGENEKVYWLTTRPSSLTASGDVGFGIDKLVDHGRSRAAIFCIQYTHSLDIESSIRALLAAVASTEPLELDVHGVVWIIKALQDDPKTNPEDLSRIEWAYLRLLDRHHDASPKTLDNRLASDPAFFCKMIRLRHPSLSGVSASREPTKQDWDIAAQAWRLLQEWRTTPGTQPDGTFLPDLFRQWLTQVKGTCSESGHLDAALNNIGMVLIHCPPDSDGLWIHHTVAEELDGRNTGEMRQGYNTGILSSRGAHVVDPTGKPERELAEQWRSKAEEIENAGYQRFATSLRRLAEDYDRQSERVVSERNAEEQAR